MATAKLTLPDKPITSRYGWRILKVSGARNFHSGIDQANGTKFNVAALGGGFVVAVARGTKHSVYGWYVRVESVDGVEWSAHSLDDEPDLKVGDYVWPGQVLGQAGMSALAASGYHVHWSLWLGSVLVDPLAYLKPGVEVRVGTEGVVADVGTATPIPTTTTTPTDDPIGEIEEDDDMAKTTGIFYERKADGLTIFALINPTSGFYSEWSGVDGTYNGAIAAGFGTDSFVKITEGHAANLKASAAAVRPRA